MTDPHCPICHEPTDDEQGVDTYGCCSEECAAERREAERYGPADEPGEPPTISYSALAHGEES